MYLLKLMVVDEALVSGGDIPCKYSSVYSSVMGRGEATYLEAIDEKSHGLQVLMKHQTGRGVYFYRSHGKLCGRSSN